MLPTTLKEGRSLIVREMPIDLYDDMRKRADEYRVAITHVMRGFDKSVGTQSMLHKLFGKNSEVKSFEGSTRHIAGERRGIPDETYLSGYLVTGIEDDSIIVPQNGVFVGFLERADYFIPHGRDDPIPLLVPEHWGVIQVEVLLERPYDMYARLNGMPLPNRFYADSLKLHEDLNPRRAGWKYECAQLQEYLSREGTIQHARKVILQGVEKARFSNTTVK